MISEPTNVEVMCNHARHSCRVNGLMPVAWCWGRDAEKEYDAIKCGYVGVIAWLNKYVPPADPPLPVGAIMVYNGLPVYRMKADGVACIGRRAQPMLGIKPLFS